MGSILYCGRCETLQSARVLQRARALKAALGTSEPRAGATYTLAAGDKPPPYDALTLAERRGLWSARWQRAFALLGARGTRVAVLEARFEGAPAGTDLGR